MEISTLPSPSSSASSALRISLSFRNGQAKTLERFLTARPRFETPEAERAELHKVFVKFDTDCDGKLSIEEIRNSMERLGISISHSDLSSLISSAYDDGSGSGEYIDFADFCTLYRSLESTGEEEERQDLGNGALTSSDELSSHSDLKYAFDLFDENRDNFISASELHSILTKLGFKEGHSLEQCKKMIEKVDSDGDGVVSFQEFEIMMKSMNE